MSRRFAAVVLCALTGAALPTAANTAQAAAAAVPAAAPPSAKAEVDFTGTVALNNCSGSLVRGPRSRDTDTALVMTNGHCLESGMPDPGEVVVDRGTSRTFALLNKTGEQKVATLTATEIEYATMTDTDVALYRLSSTYAEIQERYGVPALQLTTAQPGDGTPIRVVSGFWKRIYSCKIDATVYRLREAGWTFKDSIRYTPECDTIGGTSGSPVIDAATKQVVGINNTGNENGERCTLNNPCEIDRDGNITVHHNINYGQQTYPLARCLGENNEVDLGGDCALPKP